jgi:hypothetical protein
MSADEPCQVVDGASRPPSQRVRIGSNCWLKMVRSRGACAPRLLSDQRQITCRSCCRLRSVPSRCHWHPFARPAGWLGNSDPRWSSCRPSHRSCCSSCPGQRCWASRRIGVDRDRLAAAASVCVAAASALRHRGCGKSNGERRSCEDFHEHGYLHFCELVAHFYEGDRIATVGTTGRGSEDSDKIPPRQHRLAQCFWPSALKKRLSLQFEWCFNPRIHRGAPYGRG